MSIRVLGHRVAVITGASSGIGRGIALRLANDGYDVAINDLPYTAEGLKKVAAEVKNTGRKVLILPGDVSVEKDVRALIEDTVVGLGSVDVMVANAGICVTRNLLETTVQDWDNIFAVNARGVFLCYKYAAEQMIKQGRGGRIIGASSMAGKKGLPNFSAYSATKFAVRGLTQSVAQEVATHGITVNAYAPGPIETKMLDSFRASILTNPTAETRFTPAVGFYGTPSDVAALVSYFASVESRFVTGQTISVDGGLVFD
ncbi:hypothetical protein M413DRAFT_29242 [Hebeloma cylindrosporum]|uniref:Uncharacterized protein n=1 Tax=Hebeloma cylindrosporum TaxID=76867 RepID=A0A0C3C5H5_HEBCY|nr:hypothetical protein M413DRAFT_29242 [Hebeloma cylindrosporum h7]